MASAVRFSQNPFFGDRHSMAVLYANHSWKSIVSSCFSATRIEDIQTLQSLTLLSIFDFSAGHDRHALAWVKIGLSVRIAQSMRLMMENRTNMSYADQEERRRVFWSLYLLDKLVTCGRAQPPAILDASCQLQLPCSEVVWRAGSRQKTMSLQQLFCRTGPKPPHGAGPFSNVIAMAYTLSRTAQYMLQQFNMQDQEPPWDANSDFAAIQSDLLYLESRLEMQKTLSEVMSRHTAHGDIDQQSAGPAIFSRALFHLCYCLLHHPFLLRRRLESCQVPAPSSFLSRAFDAAWENSKRLTLLLQEARCSGATTGASFYGYCTVVAGTILALHRHHCSDTRRLESAELLKCNISFLEDLGQFYRNACSIGQSLKRFAADTSIFASLISDSALPDGLTTKNFEVVLDLLDYSTMSETAPVLESEPADSNIWHYGDACWDELFGTFDMVDFTTQSIQFDASSGDGDGTESSQLSYYF
ncbi:Fungal specific transcription factor domain-containing protein [Cladophialophora immunda]|nr:Fungal specific transcription factor domain-containing protein [Cladophialophora immunda]